jgi:2',3'-cyclic-nucleotide 2'-phosphodiesterase (5'-nucleotidase family)
MNYCAVGVGPTDLRFGEIYYQVLKRKGIPVVEADDPLPAGAKPYIIKVVNGVRVGIVSFGFLTPDRRDDPALIKRQCQFLSEARGKSDVLVLLDQGNVAKDEWLQKNADSVGAPDIVVGGPARSYLPEPTRIGNTLVIPTSSQGTYVGRLDVDIDGTDKKVTFTRTHIDEAIKDDPAVLKMAKDYEDKRLAAIQHLNTTPVATQEKPYYPFETCLLATRYNSRS